MIASSFDVTSLGNELSVVCTAGSTDPTPVSASVFWLTSGIGPAVSACGLSETSSGLASSPSLVASELVLTELLSLVGES